MEPRHDESPGPAKGEARSWYRVAVLVVSLALAAVTVYAQLRELNHISALRTAAIGLAPAWHFLETEQASRHDAVLRRAAGDPWSYRLLSDELIEALRRFLPDVSLSATFVAVRFVQNIAIFVLAATYFASFGFRPAVVHAGLAALAWSMCFANYNAGLAFDTYFDVLFYLAAATLVAHRRVALVPPLALLAATNRETALLIPLLMAVTDDGLSHRRRLAAAGATLLAQVAVALAIRVLVGPQDLIVGGEGHRQGWALLAYNVGRPVTWLNLGTTYLVLPAAAALAWRRWPARLRTTFVGMVPLWTAVHFVAGIAAETRLFLVPWVIVILPAALVALEDENRRQ